MAEEWLYYKPEFLAYWTLDESSGVIANDAVYSNDGTLVNGPEWQPAGGQIDGALSFDGDNDYVSLPSVFNPTDGPFSIAAWVQLDAKLGSVNQVIIQQEGTSGRTLLYRDAITDKLGSYLGGVGSLSDTAVFATTGQWHHVCVTYDGAVVEFYIDGLEDGSSSVTAETETSGFRLGAHKTPSPNSEYWSGLIDDVRIYERILSASEVLMLAGSE